jgi:hypothetical protein
MPGAHIGGKTVAYVQTWANTTISKLATGGLHTLPQASCISRANPSTQSVGCNLR